MHLFISCCQVHVVPAHMFRKVISITKSHCKLGLTGISLIKFIYLLLLHISLETQKGNYLNSSNACS